MKYRTIENKIELQQYWLGIIILTGVLLVVENLSGLQRFRGVIERVAQPFQKVGVEVVHAIELPYRVAEESYNSYRKIQDLELRYGEMAAVVGQQANLQMEIDELRKMLNATASTGQTERILMPILGYSQPIIANTQHNFETGDPIFINGVFVGQVGKLSQNQAQVNLFTQLFSQPILAKTETGTTGLVFGTGKEIIMREIPIEQQVSVGQKVFTSGQERILPNWYIGRVREIERHEGSPTQSVYIDQGVSFFEAKMVEIK